MLALFLVLLFPLYQARQHVKTANLKLENDSASILRELDLANIAGAATATTEESINSITTAADAVKSAIITILGTRGDYGASLRLVTGAIPAHTSITSVEGALDERLIPGLMAKLDTVKINHSPTGTDAPAGNENLVSERLIGALLSEKVHLSPEKVDRILTYAREKGVRFGAAAVALKFASQDQVLQALAEQFGYSYATEDRRKLMPELVGLNQPFSLQSEAIREIRRQVMMRVFVEGQQRCALAVVSPASGDGKTFFSANLAVALAQVGGRTLIVDADLRGPRQHEVFNVENNTGLSSVLAGHVDSQVIQPVPGMPSLFIMPVGITPPIRSS